MSASFYTPIRRHIDLLNRIEECEGILTPELEDALTVSDSDVQQRTAELLGLLDTLQTLCMGSQAVIDREKEFQQRQQAHIERVKASLSAAAKLFGGLQVGSRRVYLTPSTGTIITDAALVPLDYCRTIPAKEAEQVPDKTLIAKALKRGEAVPGASLEHRENLQIK